MTWETAILQPDIGIRFAVHIQGLKYTFLDGAKPTNARGTAWAAPQDSQGNSFTWLENSLNMQGGMVDTGAQVSRVTGEVSPSSMRFSLQDDRAGTLLDLFAREGNGGALGNLTATVAYDTGGSGTVTMTMDDASNFAVNDLVYLARETLEVTAKTSTTLTCDRDLYSLGDEDTYYTHDDNQPIAPKVVTNWVRHLHGRYIRVYAYLVDPDGYGLDSSWGSDHFREIWRGKVRGEPVPDDTWHRWTISAGSIESILQTDVGRETQEGALIRVPGNLQAQRAGEIDPVYEANGQPATYDYQASFVLDPGTAYVDLTIEFWTSEANYEAGAAPTVYDYTGADRLDLLSGGVDPVIYTPTGLSALWETVVEAQIQSDSSEDIVACELIRSVTDGQWILRTTAATGTIRISIDADAPNSVFKLLGMRPDTAVGKNATTAQIYSDPDLLTAVYISAYTNTIPFFYLEAGGAMNEDPPAPGYAIIGDDDEGEIVYYTAISAIGDTAFDGLYKMTGVQRGRMNTAPRAHRMKIKDLEATTDEVKIRFGVGAEDASILEAILQLAVSTGGGHHGAYDTLPSRVSPGLNPAHFDTAQIQQIADGMLDTAGLVDYLIMKPERLSALAAEWLAPHGMYLHARTDNSGTYTIGVGEALPALEAEVRQELTSSELDFTDPASYVESVDRIVNEVRCNYRWDHLKQEPVEESTITIPNRVSESDFGERNRVEWTLRGYRLSAGSALKRVTGWAQQVFRSFGRPYALVRVPCDRTGWLLTTGDTVEATIPGAPALDGTRGLSSRQARVLEVRKTYAGPVPGAELLLLLEPYARHSTYVPCARIASASGTTVTLEANAYTQEGSDVDHFDANDVVFIYETEGDISSRVQRTIQSKSGNDIVINSSLGFTPTAASYMVGADYSSVQASQRKHVHIADNSAPPVLSTADTTCFKYV